VQGELWGEALQQTQRKMHLPHSLFIGFLFECLYMLPGLNHCLLSCRQRAAKVESGLDVIYARCAKRSRTYASAPFSAFSAKVTLNLAASSDLSLPRLLRPLRNPVPAAAPEEVPDPPLWCWLWRVESTLDPLADEVERRRKNPPRRGLPVVVPLVLGGVVARVARVAGVVVAVLSAARDDEKMVPRLRGVAVS
jgi:hypothetical protein